MDLETLTLDQWLLQKAPVDQFPGYGGLSYPDRYRHVANYFNLRIHPEVNIGAMISNPDHGLLTDHGPGHVKTVIRRATELVKAQDCILSPYEVYALLLAIHLHDAANRSGRQNHESNSRFIFQELGPTVITDTVEARLINLIAESHGGAQKAKLDHLQPKEPVLGYHFRMQLLASILKFADELADDSTRASRLPDSVIPRANQIYHKFAKTLHHVEIDHAGKEIKFVFELNKEEATTKFGKGDTEVFLVDEIFMRTVKTHLERTYCMRFMIPHIRLDSISVKIDFYGSDFLPIHEPIAYKLAERGYPSNPVNGIADLCPDLNCSGETVRKYIEESGDAAL